DGFGGIGEQAGRERRSAVSVQHRRHSDQHCNPQIHEREKGCRTCSSPPPRCPRTTASARPRASPIVPAPRWYWLPQQKPNEVSMLKCYDSVTDRVGTQPDIRNETMAPQLIGIGMPNCTATAR